MSSTSTEVVLTDLPVGRLQDVLAEAGAGPAGGSAAALASTMAAGLVRLVARVSGEWEDAPGVAAQASALGLPGLVAQGVQVAGAAYGLLLDTWGEEFLAHGELECSFVNMVTEEQVVTACVQIDDAGHATFEVVNDTTGKTAVVGRAARTGVPSS